MVLTRRDPHMFHVKHVATADAINLLDTAYWGLMLDLSTDEAPRLKILRMKRLLNADLARLLTTGPSTKEHK